MEKMEKLIIPKDLGRFFDNYVDMIGDDSAYFEVLNDLMNDYHHMNKFEDETRRFIYYYMMEISEIISCKREYEVEK